MSTLVKAPGAGRAPVAAESPVALVCAASAFAVAAALSHLWAAPRLYVESWGYETFMWWGHAALYALVYLGLVVYAAALLRWPSQPMFLLGVGAGVAVIVLYLFGLGSGSAGVLGFVESAGVVAGAGLILVLITLLEARYRESVITALLVAGALAWALRLTGMLS